MFPSHYAFILTLIEFSNTNLAAVEVPWKIQRSEAHSFLKVPTRNKRSNPDCANIEGYCEHHLSSCREHYEVSREMFCRTNNTCTSTQLCYLVTPCPKHFKTGCHEKNCTSSPCQNGGVCEDKFNDYRCYRHGFTGKHSEIDINECASNPCQNRGTCKDHANGYSCSCVPGYIGINCEKDFNECESNPCQNGGTCTDHLNRYSCLCMQGYTGVNCQTDIDECGSNPCQHGGRCIDHVNRYRCLCVPGYIGLRCQTGICFY
ncbi:fibropellin-3-like [Mytilus trossulus]|uniref:fibropellin-3-like n=1 Tax=Mytilus trossulus TaxID=6551 RepID=UPI003006923F